jgi:8-amino-7-oxononanoate synthase
MLKEIPSPSGACAEHVLAASTESFAGLFAEGADPRRCCPAHLDSARAHRWFELVGWGTDNGYYTYQYPLAGHSGPHVSIAGHELLLISAYDYLGLIGHPAIEQAAIAAIQRFGTGTGGVRLLTGTTELHRTLERRIAALKGTDGALTVSSGYLANIGVIPALVGRADHVLLDARCHHSLVYGCRLAGVSHEFFAHNDMASLERLLRHTPCAGIRLIAVEGVYSMDGDLCPLPQLVDLKERHGALLLIDEAHAFGTVGRRGLGIHEHFGIPARAVDVWVGSLSKAIPANGGYIAGSATDMLYLQHEVAPFMFSSALCPPAVASALAALDLIVAEPHRVAAVTNNACALRKGLKQLGFDTGASASPIIPVIFHEEVQAWKAARRLLDAGIWATAVVPPAVPRGQARLRLCVTAGHTQADIDQVLRAFEQHCRSLIF